MRESARARARFMNPITRNRNLATALCVCVAAENVVINRRRVVVRDFEGHRALARNNASDYGSIELRGEKKWKTA